MEDKQPARPSLSTKRCALPPFERALRDAAVCNLCFSALGVATVLGVDHLWFFDPTLPEMLVCTLPFTASGIILLDSIVWLVRPASRKGAIDSPTRAYAMWGRMATIDAVALVLWSFGAFIDLWSRSPRSGWLCVNYEGLAGCVVVHAFLLPHFLRRALAASIPLPSGDGVPPTEWVRTALGRVATLRLLGVCAGLLAFALPWRYGFCPVVQVWSWRRAFERRSGIRLPGAGNWDPSDFLAQLLLLALLVLVCLSAWEWQRARWPLAPRLSQTRAFAAWALSLLGYAPLLLVWSLAVFWFHSYPFHPPLAGLWLLTASLIGAALVTFAFAPLLLLLALRKRSEAERLQDLATRGGAADSSAP